MKRELDTADRKIVELLQEDARLPLKSIADKVSPLRRRFRRESTAWKRTG